MSDFSAISSNYQQRAVLQKSASQKLFDLVAIQRAEDVLDLGCGPGHLTRKIRGLTDGRVVGIDPSQGMIGEARQNCRNLDITFQVCGAQSLQAEGAFDVIFCNSSFQWFRDPPHALSNCRRALRPGGRIGIQSPARNRYCPNFIQATDTLSGHPRTRATYAHFRSPWFFLETADEYARLGEEVGLSVVTCWIEEVTERFSPEKTLDMFESGASAGYLNPDCYPITLPTRYIKTARELISLAFRAQAESDGLVPVTFSRVYLLARKV